MAQLVTQGKDEPIQELQKAVNPPVEKLVVTRQKLQGDLTFWGRNRRNLPREQQQTEYCDHLDRTKTFLESLQQGKRKKKNDKMC